MRDRAYLDFVRDRVKAYVADNPSIRPYLGEEDTRRTGPKPDTSEATQERRRQERADYKRRWRDGRKGAC